MHPCAVHTAFFILLLASCAVAAQTVNKPVTVTIEVTDGHGSHIPRAQAEIVSAAGNSKVLIADEEGSAHLKLEPGKYVATVHAVAFRTAKRDITVAATDGQKFEFVLQVGGCPPGRCVEVSSAPSYQAETSPKDLPANKGSIEEGHVYQNPALQMKISLPGLWHIFERTKYSSPESKQKEKEDEERSRATCQGPLCGHAPIDVALETDVPFVHAIFLTAHQLSPEYQNRQRFPLKRFAEIMSLGSLGEKWLADGELTAIQLDGKPAYRLIIHSKQRATAKGFIYVADSNGLVFMLLGTAMSEPDRLQAALENMSFTNATR